MSAPSEICTIRFKRQNKKTARNRTERVITVVLNPRTCRPILVVSSWGKTVDEQFSRKAVLGGRWSVNVLGKNTVCKLCFWFGLELTFGFWVKRRNYIVLSLQRCGLFSLFGKNFYWTNLKTLTTNAVTFLKKIK